MAIIISKNGKNAIKIDKSNFALEDHLQQYIYDNPESIPLYDIKEDIRLLILAREFATKSGPIDALGIDKDGEIYLVETKLYKNPDKRMVVAQVLDYGASLWSNYRDFTNFTEQINFNTNKDFANSINQRLEEFYQISEDEVNVLLENVRKNLNEGNFKFVVLMDHLHDQLKDLIIYLNNNSEFTVYAVELEYYKHKDFEILIPKLYGSEVKKDLAVKRSSVTFISDQEFISLYKIIGLEKKIKEVLDLQKSMQNGEIRFDGWSTDRTPKNINFFLRAPNDTKMSLVISIGYNLEKPDQMFSFWLYNKDIEKKTVMLIHDLLKIKTNPLKSDSKYGVIARWSMKEFTKDKLIAFLSSFSIE